MFNWIKIIEHIGNKYNYYLVFFIMFVGLFNATNKTKLLHKLIGLSIFQTSIIILYLTIGFNHNTEYPIINNKFLDYVPSAQGIPRSDNVVNSAEKIYNNPLPHALMLTAIVVGVATFAVGLSIILAINKLENCKKNKIFRTCSQVNIL